MAMPILATKLFVPPPRSDAVSRPRLIARLDEGIRSGRKLTLVSAPAGFGKTTLLSEWIAQAQRRDPDLRVGWLALDESDNDPARFLAYLAAAVHEVEPHGAQSVDGVLTTLINHVSEDAHPVVLVLDDFQLIEHAGVRDAVVFLLDHLPANLHVAIASRSDPLLPVARLRARGELTELRAADLRFTADEASTFLNRVMGLSLSAEDVASLDSRTEGWIAGLQLAALSMRDRTDVSSFIAGFTGSHRFVIDYLVEEVLHRQPEYVRAFLMQTSILERLNGSLCDAITGQPGGGEMLESLERANLFVVPLDDHREWYRYHHLFADVLQARLLADDPDRVAALHILASEWFERHDLPEEAVRHALAAGDFERAARAIEATIPSVRKSRQDVTLLRWLTLLPHDTIRNRPVLCVFYAWSLLVTGDIDGVEPWLATAERLAATSTHDSADGDELRRVPVTAALYRAAVAQAQGDPAGTERQAQRAFDVAAPDDHLGRGAAAGMLGLAQWAQGDLETGVRSFEKARASLRLAGNLTDALSISTVLADMLIPLGRLDEAQHGYEEALRGVVAEGLERDQPTADLHAGFGELLVERKRLAAAAEQFAAGEALGERALSHEHRFRWFVGMARLRQAEGDLDAALDLLARADEVYLRGFFPEVRPIPALRARVWIEQGRLAQARAWADERGLSSEDEPSYLAEFEHITLARLLIAEGRSDEASVLLARLLAAAEAGHRLTSAREIAALLAGDVATLSERELHVLRLLATELTGPEIAGELYVSLNTMRTHTKNIFGKLDVNSRPAAVARARELGLI